jgi:hypothetical protein
MSTSCSLLTPLLLEFSASVLARTCEGLHPASQILSCCPHPGFLSDKTKHQNSFNLTSFKHTQTLSHTYHLLRRTRCRRRSLSSKLTAGGAVNVAPFRSGLCTANRFLSLTTTYQFGCDQHSNETPRKDTRLFLKSQKTASPSTLRLPKEPQPTKSRLGPIIVKGAVDQTTTRTQAVALKATLRDRTTTKSLCFLHEPH